MFSIIRILIAVFVIAWIVWWVNNRLLGKNLALARVIAVTLVITSVIYVLLASLSYYLE